MVEQFKFLFQDLKRWEIKSIEDCFYTIFEQGVWAVILYRLSRALYLINIPILKYFIKIIAFLIFKFSELFLGISLSPGTEIGPGLCISHTGVIVIHYKVKAGKNLELGHLVTIGERGSRYQGAPVIGDNVCIHTGAKVLGQIRIGNNVKIGANAVVIHDIPDNATAVGVPAKIVKVRNERSV